MIPKRYHACSRRTTSLSADPELGAQIVACVVVRAVVLHAVVDLVRAADDGGVRVLLAAVESTTGGNPAAHRVVSVPCNDHRAGRVARLTGASIALGPGGDVDGLSDIKASGDPVQAVSVGVKRDAVLLRRRNGADHRVVTAHIDADLLVQDPLMRVTVALNAGAGAAGDAHLTLVECGRSRRTHRGASDPVLLPLIAAGRIVGAVVLNRAVEGVWRVHNGRAARSVAAFDALVPGTAFEGELDQAVLVGAYRWGKANELTSVHQNVPQTQTRWPGPAEQSGPEPVSMN